MSKNNSTSKIAFQGVQGAYSHIACMAVCPEHEPLAKSRFSGMISAVQEKQADMAMVPVENLPQGGSRTFIISCLNQACILLVSISSQ